MEIFKAYDVRGVYPQDLSEKEAFLMGYYLVKYKNIEIFKVAHDLRLSHEQLSKFFMRGLIQGGAKPIYLGALSTPNFYHCLFDGTRSGVVITASHNGPKYNGFKFMIDLRSFDSRNGLNELGNLVHDDEDHIGVIFNEIKHDIVSMSLENFILEFSIEREKNSVDNYINFLREYANRLFDSKEIDILKNRRFAYNFSSGMSSQAMVPLLKYLEFNSNFFLEIPNGNFPEYAPNPINAQDYTYSHIEGVEGTFCYDGDGDRLMMYDEEQRQVHVDYLIGILLNYFNKIGANSFVVDLRASKSLFELSDKNNFHLEKMRVGRAFYQDYMEKNDCLFGGELSGHLFFRDFNFLDNPDIATLISLKVFAMKFLHNSSFRISEEFSKYMKYSKLVDRNLEVKDAQEAIERIKNKYGPNLVSELDGASFDFNDVWFTIRASNTEPVIRLTIEGSSEILCSNKLDEIISFLE